MRKKSLLVAFCLLFFLINVHSQLERKTWLVGGNASFNTDKNSSTDDRSTLIQVKPNIGYFFWDKISFGLNINYAFQRDSYNGHGINTHSLDIGPFMRYYFLNKDNLLNLFLEGNYAYGTYKTSGFYPISDGRQTEYSILTGTVLYFNSSIGLEFTVGYYSNKDITQDITDNGLQVGMGFHVHLKK
jgi:hypothetical protein